MVKRQKTSIVTGEEWSSRHLYDENWIEDYWKSWNHPHRTFLAERICKFSPIDSVLEIGCASGPNLHNLARKLPHTQMKGIDINPLAVQKGNEWFQKAGISNVELEVGKVQDLGRFTDKSFDVVFTDAMLIYIPPNEIIQAIKEMLRIGRSIVLNEWHTFNKGLEYLLNMYCYLKLKSQKYGFSWQQQSFNCSLNPRSASLGLFVGHWVRDYGVLFGKFVAKEKVRISKLPKGLWDDKGWRRWGALIEIEA